MKRIILVVQDEIHQLLWNQKEECGILRVANMSWEEFIIQAKNG